MVYQIINTGTILLHQNNEIWWGAVRPSSLVRSMDNNPLITEIFIDTYLLLISPLIRDKRL